MQRRKKKRKNHHNNSGHFVLQPCQSATHKLLWSKKRNFMCTCLLRYLQKSLIGLIQKMATLTPKNGEREEMGSGGRGCCVWKREEKLWSEKNSIRNHFGHKTFLVLRKCWLKKIFGPEKCFGWKTSTISASADWGPRSRSEQPRPFSRAPIETSTYLQIHLQTYPTTA